MTTSKQRSDVRRQVRPQMTDAAFEQQLLRNEIEILLLRMDLEGKLRERILRELAKVTDTDRLQIIAAGLRRRVVATV